MSSGAEDRPTKTLWDWLQLLGIPVALATLAFLLNDAQSSREQRREAKRETQQRKIEDRRAAQQRRTAADVERESTLRTYLAQMSDLMLDRRLLRSKVGADVRNVARTATLTAVRRLDGPRRGLVVEFLAEARLLYPDNSGNAPLRLSSADLNHAHLAGALLSGADLASVDLSGADLRKTALSDADLTITNLRGANLSEAFLADVQLAGANLRGANLTAARFDRYVIGYGSPRPIVQVKRT